MELDLMTLLELSPGETSDFFDILLGDDIQSTSSSDTSSVTMSNPSPRSAGEPR